MQPQPQVPLNPQNQPLHLFLVTTQFSQTPTYCQNEKRTTVSDYVDTDWSTTVMDLYKKKQATSTMLLAPPQNFVYLARPFQKKVVELGKMAEGEKKQYRKNLMRQLVRDAPDYTNYYEDFNLTLGQLLTKQLPKYPQLQQQNCQLVIYLYETTIIFHQKSQKKSIELSLKFRQIFHTIFTKALTILPSLLEKIQKFQIKMGPQIAGGCHFMPRSYVTTLPVEMLDTDGESQDEENRYRRRVTIWPSRIQVENGMYVLKKF